MQVLFQFYTKKLVNKLRKDYSFTAILSWRKNEKYI